MFSIQMNFQRVIFLLLSIFSVLVFAKFHLQQTVTETVTVSDNQQGSTTPQHVHEKAKRGGTCAFPNYDGMVAVQKSGKNAGWAMHNDQECSYGSWCPYACEPGKLMGQWDPSVTTYSYPGSQNGGLYCDSNGNLQKMNSDKDYCYDGTGTVSAVNSCSGGDVSFCQTILPGNEEMLIPTLVSKGSSKTLAVPGPDYWASTAAHYYINPPGVGVDDACQWGSTANPCGNWSPYVAGANTDSNGNTFVKIGWNPIYLETSCPFKDKKPTFGIKITCDDKSQCDGLDCAIDPSVNDINGVSSSQSSSGAGGGNFCVVTAKKGAKAKIEVFDAGSGGVSGSGGGSNNMQKRDEYALGITATHTVTETKWVTSTTIV
ncbi:SUN domain-containing protein NDAI_0A06830 [Naumovozyma dairenensis CBS 421]|uniref:Uncharacterized protein n=1 Tax=Naumovozyma dairenensis (strain ATCC 10597 / BCRC 20456 / CBS 421 / NBRC 0211 / NRRL Y-12639) TaxID=1071378 RepID=G0W4U9_NAUDC|nr:hypothetical protein NDAI_0A06830 [Naumovozyma dairenensis CBS 421]CCD22837.1 hypothetical protein NDAI_0A06830 [Naumovozyma dairenensis CBS 421]